eukprot:g17000.t1
MFRKKRRIGEQQQPQGQTAARPKAAEVDPDAPPPAEQENSDDGAAGLGGPEDVDVADMKEIQRLRKLRVGVRADGLAKRKNKEDHGSDDEEQGHPRSPNAGNTDGDGRVTKRGGLAFTSDETGENAGEKQLTREEEHMEAYIEAQLQAEMAAANRSKLQDAADAFENGGLIDPTAFAAGSSSSSSGGAGAALPGVSTHSVSGFTNSSTTSLFQIPERLRVKGHRDILDDSEKNVNWNQGLAEVEVPTKLRMENMIAAEEAKKKVLETLVAEKKKELAKKQMHLNPNPQRVLDQVYGTRFQGEFVPKSERTNQPTDDDAVKAFRKRTGAGVMKGSGSIQWPQH